MSGSSRVSLSCGSARRQFVLAAALAVVAIGEAWCGRPTMSRSKLASA
jgi:hypothetical protein